MKNEKKQIKSDTFQLNFSSFRMVKYQFNNVLFILA